MRAAATAAAFPFLLALGAADPAAAAPLCESLFVPVEGYSLVCETRVEGGARSERAVVRPTGGIAAPVLAELTVRPLDKAAEPLAWSDPDAWLGRQASFDVGGLSDAIRGLGAQEGAGAHPAARATIDGLVTMLGGWSQLPLEACTPDPAGGRRQLRCEWGAAPLALRSTYRLVEGPGDARYAVRYRAADEQQARHLEAIANSFRP